MPSFIHILIDALIALAFLVIVAGYSLTFIYMYQVTEYLLYRYRSYLDEKGWYRALFPLIFRIPAKSPRNLLIFIFVNAVEFLLIWGILVFFDGLVGNLMRIGFVILLTPLFVHLGVRITDPIAQRSRQKKIDQATRLFTGKEITFIGITGSYGKSSTKEYLHTILSTKYKVGKSQENYNQAVGIAISIINTYDPEWKFFVAEMGADHMGAIKQSVDFVKPKYGIVTSLGNQHVDTFGSKENLIKAKSELPQGVSEDGKVYINADTPDFERLSEGIKAETVLYSTKKKADVYLKNKLFINNHYEIEVQYREKVIKFHWNILGSHTIQNLLPCIAVASDIGMTEEEIVKGIGKIRPIESKLSQHIGLNNIRFINDSYNSSEGGFLAALEVLGMVPAQNKIVVSKGIIELGQEKLNTYKKIVEKINKLGVKLYTTDRDFTKVESDNIEVFESDEKILEKINKESAPADLVLIEGRFSPQFMKGLELHDADGEQHR